MSILIDGKSKCSLCDKIMLNKEQKLISFSAFIPHYHRLSRFSDATFHIDCFKKCPQATEVLLLDKEFREEYEHMDFISERKIDEFVGRFWKDKL
jgi:hypothetical protein